MKTNLLCEISCPVATLSRQRATTNVIRQPHLPCMNTRLIIAALSFAGGLLTSATPAAAQRQAIGVHRDSHGRIARSSKARTEFKKATGYPHGRPGYVIDHIVPLSRGGSDSPGNMQWQTKTEAKAKDHWERGGSHSSTYRSRSYSRKSYAPRHRASKSTYHGYRSYHAPRSRNGSHYHASHRRR